MLAVVPATTSLFFFMLSKIAFLLSGFLLRLPLMKPLEIELLG